ncbi:MAG: hypothetical protein IJP45_07860, partial [Paludibacteraceae bacterium]|nr:hypothetical protein [Paludibacteraceae bacterium]
RVALLKKGTHWRSFFVLRGSNPGVLSPERGTINTASCIFRVPGSTTEKRNALALLFCANIFRQIRLIRASFIYEYGLRGFYGVSFLSKIINNYPKINLCTLINGELC